MMRSARTMGFAKKFKRLGRPRRYNSDDEDDEELLFSNSQNNYTANETEVEVGTGRHKKKWRSLSIGEPEQLLVGENPDCYVVFPAGIYLRIASNPNPCDMLLSFNLPGLGGGYTEVVIPSMGMVKDVEILRPAEEGAPRSQKWCELFGIITGENLKRGIVETRDDGNLVVWRRFRHNVDMLTPFALHKIEDLDASSSPYMVYTRKEYDELLFACSGVSCAEITVKAEALFKKFQHLDLKPIHIEVLNPAVVSNIQPDTTDPDSYVINSGVVIQNITIDSESDIYNVSTHNTIDLHNGSDDLLENLAQFAIENESGV